ncbi:response regulator [Desulfobacter hydrogenophilus]|uniref:Response regulator n=1 Tax=Desulfobacter hydrogenophilus TaxID=2291 RepID=A0A328FFP2_9BACT|nr:response regulator [Desulfobacter hydrogenophilus]NDY73452.1 response regulator [Desulfobacter hydrogenophilus]QBH14422.1 response regulator [Desulfobacter hydrogenophilus]RAM02252.1 response regulator [Desulfobacter hydrogenophilus]
MTRYFILMFILIVTVVPCQARDFMVEFVEENYMENQEDYAKTPMIYHSFQVRSHAGLKMLVLTGGHPEYRTWLRQYVAQDKGFIVKVPDNENDLFIASKIYETDVRNVHPFNPTTWSMEGSRIFDTKDLSDTQAWIIAGPGHILVLDQNDKRSELIDTVVKRMGYIGMISGDPEVALGVFRNQPEKFKMIIVNYDMPGMGSEAFVDKLLNIDHKIPILVETGYNNEKLKRQYLSKFSGAGTVTVTPVVLDRLQQNIKNLIKSEKETAAQPVNG